MEYVTRNNNDRVPCNTSQSSIKFIGNFFLTIIFINESRFVGEKWLFSEKKNKILRFKIGLHIGTDQQTCYYYVVKLFFWNSISNNMGLVENNTCQCKIKYSSCGCVNNNLVSISLLFRSKIVKKIKQQIVVFITHNKPEFNLNFFVVKFNAVVAVINFTIFN